MKTSFRAADKANTIGAAASWSAAGLRRFSHRGEAESARPAVVKGTMAGNGLAHSKTWRSSGRPKERGIMLIDCLVYMVLFFAVTGVAFSFFYTCWDGSFALRRNSDDITNALRAGEKWRADVRNASGPIKVEESTDGEVLRIPQKSGEVEYKFSSGSLSRSPDGQSWREVLQNVKTSRMESDRRQQVTAWRWEIELMATKKKTLQTHPLFTFEAVPNPGNP